MKLFKHVITEDDFNSLKNLSNTLSKNKISYLEIPKIYITHDKYIRLKYSRDYTGKTQFICLVSSRNKTLGGSRSINILDHTYDEVCRYVDNLDIPGYESDN